MTIEIQRFEDATELEDIALPFLMRHEAHHNLILGLIYRLGRTPGYYGSRSYFAAAVAEGKPVAAAVMTPPFPLALSLLDDDEAVSALARDAHDYLPTTAGVVSPVPGARRFADAWQQLTGEAVEVGLAERIYKLESLTPPSGVPGSARQATSADLDLLASWQVAFMLETTPWEPPLPESIRNMLQDNFEGPVERTGRLLWEVGGEPVSMVGYSSPTPNSLRVAPVYTPPQFRRRGYASACTAEACRYILESGKSFVTLFADLANRTSNHVYQEIGFEPVCDAEMIRFAGR